MPNVRGHFSNYGLKPADDGGYVVEGCFYNGADSYIGTHVAGPTNNWHAQLFELSASRNSGIYGNSNTVIPSSQSTLLCIKY